MQAAQLAIIVARVRWHAPRWFTASLVRTQVRRWWTLRQTRSDLFRVPSSVKRELQARGFDIDLETNKPFWRP